MERWLPVVGFEGAYEVSDQGRVRSIDREWQQLGRGGSYHTHRKPGQMLRPGRMPGGHLSVALGRGRSKCVHKLVLDAFVGPAPAGCEARHINGVESDNRFDNLVWDTRGNNTRDKKWHRGTTLTKLRPPQISEIKRALLGPRPRGLITRLAERHDVSDATIHDIISGKVHVDVQP